MARITGHTAAVTAIAMQAGRRLAASVDAAGCAMVWRASDLMPLASVPAAAQHSRQEGHPKAGHASQHSSGATQASDRAVAWLPAPDAVVGVLPGDGARAPRVEQAEGQQELLVLADRERMRVWSVPAKSELARAAEPREAASAPMPEGCEGVRQLTVLTETTGSADKSSTTASTTVLARSHTTAHGEVIHTWQLTRQAGSHGDGVQLAPVDELRVADIGTHSDGSGARPMPPQGSAAAFATLLHHESVQLATADPAAGEISLYRLSSESVPGAQPGVPADTPTKLQAQLVATASLRGASNELSEPAQQARTASRKATSMYVINVALSASVRQLAAIGTQGASKPLPWHKKMPHALVFVPRLRNTCLSARHYVQV